MVRKYPSGVKRVKKMKNLEKTGPFEKLKSDLNIMVWMLFILILLSLIQLVFI